jgi:hypothetical protein
MKKMRTITATRNMIGAEYLAMCNTYDREEIEECAKAIETLAQKLIELCEMPLDQYQSQAIPEEA